MKILLDTNICIYLIKNKPAGIRKRLDPLSPGDVGISSITAAELRYQAGNKVLGSRFSVLSDRPGLPMISSSACRGPEEKASDVDGEEGHGIAGRVVGVGA
jgi:predicted nucleic acid-binding protein